MSITKRFEQQAKRIRGVPKYVIYAMREYPNGIVFYTAGLYIGWGMIFLMLNELPLPFAGIQFYADNGGKEFWGPAFTIVGFMAAVSAFVKGRERKFLLVAPSLLVVFFGAYGMVSLLLTVPTPRLWVGSGYVLPHAIFYALAIGLNYGIPHQQYLNTLSHYGRNISGE